MTNSVLHKAATRGHADHGWLASYHTFSFGHYHDPTRMQFGALRVLNDDTVSPGRGFARHRHENMEIISIPLEGDLEHEDSAGNKAIIQEGDIQVMSAGSGIFHSEKNRNLDKAVKFLQIWVIPKTADVTPRYDQVKLNPEGCKNQWQQILSPNEFDDGVWIHQNAWFHLGCFDVNAQAEYLLKDPANNGVYAFILQGSVKVSGQDLEQRDGFGLWNAAILDLVATSDCKVLLMEVPMI